MKKISTLGFGMLLSIVSFANFAPSRLTVAVEDNANIKVTVDGSRFDQQAVNSSVVFENLEPGFHSVKVYQLADRAVGFWERKRGGDYRLLYTASVNIKPLFATTLVLNRFGNAQINEQPMRGYDKTGWGNGDRRNDDHGYNGNDNGRNDRAYNNNDQYGQNSGYGNDGYSRSISNEDFFAAERVMERENFDDARLLYAKRLMDETYLCAEQVKELARFFSFDNSRLDFAKYAYNRTTDKNNFSVVCNAFSSGNGRDQLMNFIRNCK